MTDRLTPQPARGTAGAAVPAPAVRDSLVPFIMPTSWVKAALRCGFSIEPLLREAGMQLGQSGQPVEWVSARSLHALMRLCVQRAALTHHFPFVLGEEFAFDHLPAFDTYVTTSPTLRDSLRALDWVSRLMPNLTTQLSEEGERAVLRVDVCLDEGDDTDQTYTTEVVFAALNKFARMLLGESVHALEIDFTHHEAQRLAQYEALFRSPVKLGQPVCRLVFERALLDAPLRGAVPHLHKQAEALVTRQVDRHLPRRGVVAEVEHCLRQEPQLLRMGLDGVASHLKLHPRTLQRRLQDESDSFADLASRVRLGLAREWLEEGTCSIEDISERLGFADRHSFSRAFRRWSGQTPSAFRRQARA